MDEWMVGRENERMGGREDEREDGWEDGWMAVFCFFKNYDSALGIVSEFHLQTFVNNAHQ